MTFGPNSNNPRERRAYAYAKLVKARETGTTGDYQAAYRAVGAAGTSRKSQKANLGGQLLNLAMQDQATRTLAEQGRRLLDPELMLTEEDWHDDPDHFVTVYREIEFSSARETHVAVTFDYTRDKTRLTPNDFYVVDLDKQDKANYVGGYDRSTWEIPIEDGHVDVAAARLFDDVIRERLVVLVTHAVTMGEQK